MVIAQELKEINLLSKEQIQHFHEKGWVGPLDAFSPEQVNTVKEYIKANSKLVTELNGGKKALTLYNNIYNTITIRDHHLFHKPIAQILKHESIVQRLSQLEEENLLSWRSDIFCLIPNQGSTKWHQYKKYYWMCDIDYDKPTLTIPSDRNYANFSVSGRGRLTLLIYRIRE